jgi:adenylate kinase
LKSLVFASSCLQFVVLDMAAFAPTPACSAAAAPPTGGAATGAATSARAMPNILITGTPGTGKTATAALCASTIGGGGKLAHVDCSKLVVDKRLHLERNEEFDTWMLDDDALCDELEEQMALGGNIVDFHTVDFFPERWFDLVLVLRTDNTVLYDRLQKRGYSQKKITENIECEIMQVLLEEARESYDLNIVHEVRSDNVDDLENNVELIEKWCRQWSSARAAAAAAAGQ